ncbi:hypothetical protein [Thalassotalea aquiviva]|uniref:hypothetical protein n=1 Tax=Thalassotalea aquiviva TaxID=3242415 RepID=UPI00352A135B
MFNSKYNKITSILLLGASLTLTGCDLFDDDNDKKIDPPVEDNSLFKGDVLKGDVIKGDVNLYAATDLNTSIFKTVTDENGNFSTGGFVMQSGIYMIKVTSNGETTMVCDTTNCGTEESPIGFGATVPASQLTDLELSTVTYIDAEKQPLVIDEQISAMSTVGAEMLIASLEKSGKDISSITEAGFKNLEKKTTKLTFDLFGITAPEGANLFDLSLPSLNKQGEISISNELAATVSMFNASIIGASGDGVSISDAINNTAVLATSFILDDTPANNNAWLALQKNVANKAAAVGEAQAGNIPASAVSAVESNVNNGISLDEIKDSVTDIDNCASQDSCLTGGTGGTGITSTGG